MNIKLNRENRGFVLITTMMMLTVLLALLAAYFETTKSETQTYKAQRDSNTGFYAAEGGLNIRAELIRGIFLGYNRPAGTSPTSTNPCTGTNIGSGHYDCQTTTIGGDTVSTYVTENAGNPVILTIPPGERYQNLNAQEYRYTTTAQAKNANAKTEALLELKFKSRLVPLFQFAAFYNKDLEILPGPTMTLNGPVHTNGDLYLNAETGLTINGQVTAAGNLYRGRKNDASCTSINVRIYDPTTARALYASCASRRLIVASDLTPYHNMLQFRVQPVTVPSPDEFDATPGKTYWDKADLRLVLNLGSGDVPVTTNSTTAVEVRNTSNALMSTETNLLNTCAGSIGGRVATNTFTMRNQRENKNIRMLDVDMQGLLNCLRANPSILGGKLLSDNTEGGLVFHFTVKGPNEASTANAYGVRVRNAAQLQSSVGGAPQVIGMTIVSDQAAYTLGNYNSTGKIPAAIMADSLNVLSTNWSDTNSALALGSRLGGDTTINAAFLAGTDTTGNQEGSAGQSLSNYNGGLENYPRFHENWTGRTLTYRGSFVSLGRPKHVTGTWSSQSYNPPNRAWDYDTAFNNAAQLPPITPRFVYLRQELFVRDFEQ